MNRGSLIVAFALFILPFTVNNGFCASIESQLQSIARESRKSLPMQIDDAVQATNIAAIGKTLLNTYHFTKPNTSLGNLSDLKAFYYRSSLNAACTNPDVLQTLKLGVSVIYDYYDVNNRFVMKFTIDNNTCRNFQ